MTSVGEETPTASTMVGDTHEQMETLNTWRRLTFYLLDPHLPGDKEDGDVVEKTGKLFQYLQDQTDEGDQPEATFLFYTSLIL